METQEIIFTILSSIAGFFIKSLITRSKNLEDKLETYKKEADVKIDNIKNEVYKDYYSKEEYKAQKKDLENRIDKLHKEIQSNHSYLIKKLDDIYKPQQRNL